MNFIDTVKFAMECHDGQLYGELPYSYHLDHVHETYRYLFGDPDIPTSRVIYLHDILEDTDTTEDELLHLGLPIEEVWAVNLLTKRRGMSRNDQLHEACKSEMSLKVKIADSTSNYIHSLRDGNQRLIGKYEQNLRFLWAELKWRYPK